MCSQQQVVGLEFTSGFAAYPLDFGLLYPRSDDADYAGRHAILKIKRGIERTLEAVCPEMRSVARINELASNTKVTAGLAHTAFHHVSHAEVTSDLPHIGRLAFVGKT